MSLPINRRIRTWWLGEGHAMPGVAEKYVCGTLHYTPATLAVLFGWLLWGDVTMTLMDSLPSLLVMQLKDHAISNQAMAILMGTLATTCNFALNPVISYSSDRHRGRWGRRRPILLFATPFVTLFLILIPWAPEITQAILRIHWIRAPLQLCPVAPIVLVFGLLIGLFQIFHVFVGAAYSYLIPDTVPEPFLGRFYGMLRIFGTAAGMLFNWFVFGQAHAHMRLVFAVFSLIYFVSFMMMSWKVREGEYPPIREERGHWFSPVRNYVKECFGEPRYWLIFVIYGAAGAAWAESAGVFGFFFWRDQIGFTEMEIGRLSAITDMASFLLAVPLGILIDRLGSQKSMMIGLVSVIIGNLLAFLLIHDRTTAYAIMFARRIPMFMIALSFGKWTVDMYPRAQYGQFGSAGAMVGALGCIFFGPLAGKLVDLWGNFYRLCFVFPVVFHSLALICSVVVYYWKKPNDLEPTNDKVDTPVLSTETGGQ